MKSIRVLVVDDSITIRAMMTRVLQSDAAISVVTTRSVAEAEEALAGERFDVITLDVEMPGVNGLDYLKQLTARHDLPVVMLSASTGSGNSVRTEALLRGAAGCFDKADAVRNASDLIGLVRAAALHKARIGPDDARAMADRRTAEVASEPLDAEDSASDDQRAGVEPN